jgi:NADH dehydrogenase
VRIWAAGVAASPLGRALAAPLDRAGRVKVAPDLSLPDHPEVFVIGDLAHALDPSGNPLPGVAPVAIQQGQATAKNILRKLAGEQTRPFQYRDKGSMATIGRAAAIARIGKLELSGFIAWLGWLFVHIMYLVGFRNRLLVLFKWTLSYLTYERSARLITESDSPPTSRRAGPASSPDEAAPAPKAAAAGR